MNRPKEEHVNFLYVEDDNAGHFALIKDLSRLAHNLTEKRTGHFSAIARAQNWRSTVKTEKLNDCAITLLSESDKWLSFTAGRITSRSLCTSTWSTLWKKRILNRLRTRIIIITCLASDITCTARTTDYQHQHFDGMCRIHADRSTAGKSD
ncbi:PREDICTED: uncharacterized protein LOC105143251 [Acromyrmex echinatior]|uniref:uncharacterized protein LOC105143251 n=1 Tax=Acromyrmex echinatior TaxID=103372 RepID=UPI000580E9FF|nr:PREDICTED: uncharacterized protein LOC105143251 [Acromyrmex echinatior]